MVVNLFNFLYTFAAGKIVTLNQINMITKNKMKNYLKLGIFLFGISLILVNCKNNVDDIIADSKSSIHVKHISYNQLKKKKSLKIYC